MTYFDQIDPINDIFDQTHAHEPDRNSFSKVLEKIFFTTFTIFDILCYCDLKMSKDYHNPLPGPLRGRAV